MKLIFATNNPDKLKELQQLLGKNIELLSLNDIGCEEEVPENHTTLEENAAEKASYIYKKYKLNCFADDTGLEIEALNNEPGVYSARYAGQEKNFNANIQKVIEKLQGIKNRRARFRTVISLIIEGKEIQLTGIVNGTILKEKKGTEGFGYDSIFQPDGYNKSFAQMSLKEKNKISHRGIAVRKLINYLKSLAKN